jgi:hypothetical protein
MTIKIGNYTYSGETERRLKYTDKYQGDICMYERRGRESMVSDRLNINYMDVHIYDGWEGFKVSIKPYWVKIYSTEEFYKGREEFVERVIMDYTFGVT